MTIESARSSTDVVLGTLLVNSTPATTLFDSNVSHVFVSKHYVANKGLITVPLRQPMPIDFPRKALKAKRICPRTNININGVDFPADLVVLELTDIDVTLGFGWLSAFEGVIQSVCSRISVAYKSTRGKDRVCVYITIRNTLCGLSGEGYSLR
jgi:hypothetical protein